MRWFLYIIFFYFFLQARKIFYILQDKKVALEVERFKKKKRIIFERKNIFDKNNLLIQYSEYEGRRQLRRYLIPELIPILGIVGFEERGMSGLEAYANTSFSHKKEYYTAPPLTGKDCSFYIEKTAKKNDAFVLLDAKISMLFFPFLKKAIEKHHSDFGVCIIMDGVSGAIESYLQYPAYDEATAVENKFFFLHPIGITQAYEMGSIMKAFLLLSALEADVVKPNELINCYGTKEKWFKKRLISTWKAHGVIPFREVIKGSNNIGVAQIGLKIGKKLYEYYKKCGFGSLTGVEINGEHKGILHLPDRWSTQSVISLTFGYEISVTLLQAIVAWSLFLNEGKMVSPRLLATTPHKVSEVLFSKRAIDDARDILELNQVNMKQFGLKKKLKGRIFGKTGTANILVDGKYSKEKNAYSFLGHYEYEGNKKIIGIFIHGSNDHRLFSSNVTLPLFLEIVSLIDNFS